MGQWKEEAAGDDQHSADLFQDGGEIVRNCWRLDMAKVRLFYGNLVCQLRR
jgi:hypothetical protein